MAFNSYAQVEIPMDTVINKGTYRDEGACIYLNIFDNISVSLLRGNYRKKSNSYLIINNDTSRIHALSPMYFEDIILFEAQSEAKEERKLVSYKLSDKSFYDYGFSFTNSREDDFILDKSFTKLYSRPSNKNGIKIFLIEPLTKEKNLFADFSEYNQFTYADYTSNETNFAGIKQVYFFNNYEAVVKLGYNKEPSVGYEDYRYFLVSGMAKKELTSKIIPKELINTSNPYINSSIQFVSHDEAYFRESFNGSGIFKNRLINNNYEVINEVLLLGNSSLVGNKLTYFEHSDLINGINLQNKQILCYYLNSKTDDKTEVIIPYKFIPELDLAMYKAYKNKGLTKEDIKGFGEYELGILRNLIFAKHNYDFSSEFYQAYFNLYAFYNDPEMRNARTKNVNEKLTAADKTNLELIKGME